MAAGAVALGGLAVACGDSESATTSTTIVSKGAAGTSGSGSSSGAGSSDTSAPAGANSEFAAEIEARGAPTLAAVSGPVAELKVTDDVAGTGTAAHVSDDLVRAAERPAATAVKAGDEAVGTGSGGV